MPIKRIFSVITIYFIFVLHSYAGPYIKIKDIKVDSKFASSNIEVLVQIRNLNRFNLADLAEENLLVYENGYRVNYVKVKRTIEIEDYLYFVFSIDSSKSIGKKFLKTIKSSASEIIKNSGPLDKIAVFRFNDEVKTINFFTTKNNDLVGNIESINRYGKKTLLYDSIYDSIDLLKAVHKDRRIIIVFTDGKDEGSSDKIDDIIKESKASKIPIYFICIQGSKHINKMARIAKLSGGKLVLSNSIIDMVGMYKTIISIIKNNYTIKYKSILENDGKEHLLEIKLKSGIIVDSEKMKFKMDNNFLGSLDVFTRTIIIIISIFVLLIIIIFLLITFFRYREKRFYRLNKNNEPLPTIVNTSKIDNNEVRKKIIPPTPIDPEQKYASAWLIEKDGPESGRRFPISKGEVSIGRGKNNNIVLEDESISINHAKIKNVGNNFHLFDLISDNGVFLNNKKMLRPRILQDWDEVKIGEISFIFRGTSDANK